MPIPTKKVQLGLTKSTPSKLTTEVLKTQLNNIGLTCKHTSEENLKVYKDEVLSKVKDGKINSFSILKPKENKEGVSFTGEYGNRNALYLGLEESSIGDWEPDSTGLGYSRELHYIQFPTHFDYLKEQRSEFAGVGPKTYNYTGKYDTVDAIMSLFEKVATDASANVVNGLDKSTLESVLSNAIAPLKDQSINDYDHNDSRVIYLVENYDEETQLADGVGVLTIDWHLKIKDYKKKKENLKHDTNLDITVRSVLYDDIQALYSDYYFVKSHFKTKAFLLAIPPKPHELKIYDNLPPAVEDTFYHGLPLINDEKHVDVMILHSADIESLGCLDNSNSDVKSSYSKSTTSGFSFSMTQKLSSKLSFSAGVVFAKAGVEIGLELSFTETWNNSQTETIQFSIEGGKKAFVYQGYLQSSILRYDAEEDSFKYIQSGRFLTDIFKTSDKPLLEN